MDPILFNYAIEGTALVLVGAGYYISRKIKEKVSKEKDSKLVDLVKPVEVKRD